MPIEFNENVMATTSILNGFSIDDIQEMIEENPSLRGYLQGYLAERALKRQLLEMKDITSVTKIGDQEDSKGDLLVTYKDVQITIECKSVLTDSIREDVLTQAWSGRVLTRNTDKRDIVVEGYGDIRTSKLIRGQFDILAICCFAVSGEWDFLFLENRFMPSAEEHDNLLKTSFSINPTTTPGLTHDVTRLLEKTLQIKAQRVDSSNDSHLKYLSTLDLIHE